MLRYKVRLSGGKYDGEPVARFSSLSQARLYASTLAAGGEGSFIIDTHDGETIDGPDHARAVASNTTWLDALRIDAVMEDADAIIDQYAALLDELRAEAQALRTARRSLLDFPATREAVEEEMRQWAAGVADRAAGLRPQLVSMRRDDPAMAAD